MFFKDVIFDLTRYCRAWFPLVDLQSCEVMGDFRYRHTMLYIYAKKSEYIHYNLIYKEIKSDLINTFSIKYIAENDEERVITVIFFFKE